MGAENLLYQAEIFRRQSQLMRCVFQELEFFRCVRNPLSAAEGERSNRRLLAHDRHYDDVMKVFVLVELADGLTRLLYLYDRRLAFPQNILENPVVGHRLMVSDKVNVQSDLF